MSSTAPPATPLPGSSGVLPIKGEKRTDPKKWPKYTEAEQKLITEFLMAYGLAALTAVERAKEMDQAAPGNHVISGTIKYWSNAVSIIDWMIQKVPQRQRQVQLLRDRLAAEERT